MRKKLGIRIKELRTEKGISQEKFADLVGIDRTYLSSVEKGERNISLDNICKIAKGFEISVEKLFKGLD